MTTLTTCSLYRSCSLKISKSCSLYPIVVRKISHFWNPVLHNVLDHCPWALHLYRGSVSNWQLLSGQGFFGTIFVRIKFLINFNYNKLNFSLPILILKCKTIDPFKLARFAQSPKIKINFNIRIIQGEGFILWSKSTFLNPIQ